jgi:tRNA (guanine-N7-)-methyltransferase
MIDPTPSFPWRHIRSFARRDSRMTVAQQQAYEKLWPRWGLTLDAGSLDLGATFGREAACFLELGFGSGHSLTTLAARHPEYNFIGIETFRPGIGALLHQIERLQLTNIRVYYADAVEVLQKAIPPESLQGLQIFFPDPWPKTRHHKRRLIQKDFVASAVLRLKLGGILHLATDWQDYAVHMMKVLSAEPALHNLAGEGHYAERSNFRPVVTKFESRGESAGRRIWELQFARV